MNSKKNFTTDRFFQVYRGCKKIVPLFERFFLQPAYAILPNFGTYF